MLTLKALTPRTREGGDGPAIKRWWLALLLSLPLLLWFVPYFLRVRTLSGGSLMYRADGGYDWRLLLSLILIEAFLVLVIPIIGELGQRFPIWSQGRLQWRNAGSLLLLGAGFTIIRPVYNMTVRTLVRGEDLGVLTVAHGRDLSSDSQAWTIIPQEIWAAPGEYLVILVATQVWFFYWRSRDRERQLTRARLSALKAQLRPHFLFNTLHSISTLMEDDVPAARRMIAGLADLLRASLTEPDGERVSLEEEIDVVRTYLDIESIRFADRLRVRYDLDDDALGAGVPHLILQPLVENAVRHGVSHLSSDAEIKVRARRIGDAVEIAVADNGPGPGPADLEGPGAASIDPVSGSARPVGGLGLRNVRERVLAFYGPNAALDLEERPGGGGLCRLTLPYQPLGARRRA
ncbi:MAG: histidine kinase [Acidobacteriota bacterium]